MKTVKAYEIDPEVPIYMPQGARLLGVDAPSGSPVLYAVVDTDEALVHRTLHNKKAGEDFGDLPEAAPYLGLLYHDGEALHFFDGGES